MTHFPPTLRLIRVFRNHLSKSAPSMTKRLTVRYSALIVLLASESLTDSRNALKVSNAVESSPLSALLCDLQRILPTKLDKPTVFGVSKHHGNPWTLMASSSNRHFDTRCSPVIFLSHPPSDLAQQPRFGLTFIDPTETPQPQNQSRAPHISILRCRHRA